MKKILTTTIVSAALIAGLTINSARGQAAAPAVGGTLRGTAPNPAAPPTPPGPGYDSRTVGTAPPVIPGVRSSTQGTAGAAGTATNNVAAPSLDGSAGVGAATRNTNGSTSGIVTNSNGATVGVGTGVSTGVGAGTASTGAGSSAGVVVTPNAIVVPPAPSYNIDANGRITQTTPGRVLSGTAATGGGSLNAGAVGGSLSSTGAGGSLGTGTTNSFNGVVTNHIPPGAITANGAGNNQLPPGAIAVNTSNGVVILTNAIKQAHSFEIDRNVGPTRTRPLLPTDAKAIDRPTITNTNQ
jgi:hypothetical protein